MHQRAELVGDMELAVSRTIAAPPARVFQAWTEERHLQQWFGPKGFTTHTRRFEFREGGVWEFEMVGPDGTRFPNWIAWRTIDRPNMLRYEQGTHQGDPESFETTVTFADVNGKTHITLHSRFQSQQRRDEVVERFGAIEGGYETLARLEVHANTLHDPAYQRRLVTWNLQTLDGHFEATSPWSLDFHMSVWGDELEAFSLDQLDQVGALVFGRDTYEGMASYWMQETGAIADRMNSLPKIVFSNTLKEATWNNSTLMHGNAIEAMRRLKQEAGKDLYIFGSAKLCDTFMRANLIDEYRICLAPVVLREGTPLYKPGGPMQRFTLLGTQPLRTGGVVLRYAPMGDDGVTASP